MNNSILHRYFIGEASEKDRIIVMTWIEKSQQNYRYAKSLRKRYDMQLWRLDETNKILKVKYCLGFSLLKKISIAASIFLFAFLINWTYFQKTDMQELFQTVHIPAGQRGDITLSDGTKVWLNSNSIFSYPISFVSS